MFYQLFLPICLFNKAFLVIYNPIEKVLLSFWFFDPMEAVKTTHITQIDIFDGAILSLMTSFYRTTVVHFNHFCSLFTLHFVLSVTNATWPAESCFC